MALPRARLLERLASGAADATIHRQFAACLIGRSVSECSIASSVVAQHAQWMPKKRCYSSSSPIRRPYLVPPTVIYSDNHLLVVNKPPGWHVHAIPEKNDNNKKKKRGSERNKNMDIEDRKSFRDESDDDDDDDKCLIHYLQHEKLGGGSQQTFLKPLHRIDQPCSGVLLFAKTSKAASRITKLWQQKFILKTYLCLIDTELLSNLKRSSMPTMGGGDDDEDLCFWDLSGYWHKKKTQPFVARSGSKGDSDNQKKVPIGWNVQITPELRNPSLQADQTRWVHCQWKLLLLPNNSPTSVLLVQTHDGARHMIRALLSQVGGCPIVGDSRYGGSRNNHLMLPDRSVALHARSVTLPDNLQLGSLTQRHFLAPIPDLWKKLTHGSMTEDTVEDLLWSQQQ
jgi:23S rRNA pseudouridine1911/1915/1917 synthase